jgi:molybdenum cofactor synthesis domain-containing protein
MSIEVPKASPTQVTTACALLIGNELLNGSIADCNLVALARTLRSIGIRLKRTLVLPDDVTILTEEIREASRQFDVVFTSGGVGPTHDDVTIAAAAQAFNVDTVTSEELRGALVNHYGEPLSEGHERLAVVPRGSSMVKVPESTWPTIVMHNVWILPGVPAIFRAKLGAVRHFLKGPVHFYSCAVMCRSDELTLKSLIDQTVRDNPDVEIGSYPLWPPTDAQTKITFEGTDTLILRTAVDEFVSSLPANDLLRVEDTSDEEQ